MANNTNNPKGGGQFGNTNGFKKGGNQAPNLTVRGRIAISNGKKNTTNVIKANAKRTTFVSLDGGLFRPFGLTPISEITLAKEVRCYGKEFSLYQEERLLRHPTANNIKKVVWVCEVEFGEQYFVPNNILYRAMKDGIKL